MRATDLSELAAFDAVARHHSFRRASEERGVTASAISHAVSNLEARVGIRLLNRTTRSVSLTDAGAMLFAQMSPAFGDVQHRETLFCNMRRERRHHRRRSTGLRPIRPRLVRPACDEAYR
jgi:DNA-binding transcriptional LysR family regulator